jgi:hypothetical protein
MDALKYIPDNVNVLKTERGDARLQKTDIFKKLMWFSYPREENWVPVPLTRVKEIQQMNRDGVIPPDLGEVVEVETKPVKILDYENVVGQDSLTRLDDHSRNRKKNQNRNDRNRDKGGRPNGADRGQRPVQANESGQKPAVAQGPQPEGTANPNKKKKFRPNRNRQNRPDNRGGQPDKQ